MKTPHGERGAALYRYLHNSVETTCTTNPEQIEVMELEGYSRPTYQYNKLVHSATMRSTVVGVNPQPDRRRVLLTTPIHRRLVVANFIRPKCKNVT